MQLSVIIPTKNEKNRIGRVVRDLRTYGGDQLAEIIVVDADSTDGTATEASRAGATVLSAPRPGRAAQMNFGATHATGDVLYFVHADVGINPDFVADIEASVRAGYEAGCYRFRFDSGHPLLRVNSFCTRFRGMMSRGGDQTLFITRRLFNQLEGFDERYVIMEDFDIIRRIQAVTSFCIIPKDVVVSARKYDANSWLRVQLANLTAFSMFFLRAAPTRIERTYKAMLNHR